MTTISRRQFLAGLSALSTLVPENLSAVPAPSQPFSVVHSPFLQSMRPDSVTVMWGTVEPGTGYVRYSTSGSRTAVVRARRRTYFPIETGMPLPYEQYQVDLVGLKPNRQYVYSAMVNNQQIGNVMSCHFRTAGPGQLNFLVFREIGNTTHEHFAIAYRIGPE